ncbi:SdpA family antimicrobial peptide system protein [Fictibacillus enclensis]|uniref:SdpA family antimicrobial peptide system protein n=1 Tax=Fictibacillus enclensis TaxID=1017270 RepID=UPI0025A1BC55|nr:SdpA family antimicrobial peptide system protein [Fictibacillus enclensis]MDM5336501.1 SdpA family antimicrobial peptide system protein [Fictibacillus enclensis]
MIKKTAIVFILFSAVWGSLFTSSILSGLGTTPLPISKDTKIMFASILPQGWGFFSKSPRDSLLGMHTANAESLDVLFPTMRMENALGLYRKGRSQGVEMGALSMQISKKDWKKCKNNSLEECESLAKKITLNNKAPSPLLCGEYFFTKEEIVPWSYFKYSDSGTEIKEIVRADVKCFKK